jgi:hypothetical protein
MPIPRGDFDTGRTEDSDESRVIGYLDAHPNEAFSSLEIATAIGHELAKPPAPGASKAGTEFRELQQSVHLAIFETFLVRLASEGKIERKVIERKSGRGWYFASKI